MKQFWVLTRVNVSMALYQMSLTQRFRGRRSGGHGFQAGLGVIVVVIMAYMGFWATMMTRSFNKMGYGWLTLIIGLMIISALILGLGLYTFNSLLFESADTDQLFAYPLPKFTVLAGKVAGLVVQNWAIALVIWLPIVGVYTYFTHPGPVFFLFALLSLLVIPGIPLFALSLISYIVGLVSSGPQLRKILQVVVSIGLIALLAFGIRAAAQHAISTAKLNGDVFGLLQHYYPPAGWATTAMANGSWGAMGWAVLWNVVPFVAIMALIAASYAWIRSRMMTSTRVTRGHVTYTSASVTRALFGKELSRLTGSTMYLINSCIGGALVILFSFLLSIKTGKNAAGMQDLIQALGISMTPVVLVFFLFLLSLANTTSPSISLEGKNLWIVQSLPIDPRPVLRAKLMVQASIITPLAVIGSLIAIFTVHIGFAGFVQVVIPCVLFTLVSACVGLIANLHYHRFDFYNDMQVVRNSASVLMTYGIMVVVVALATFCYWLWRHFIGGLNFWAYWGVWVVILAAAVVVLYRYIMTKGVALFQQLSD